MQQAVCPTELEFAIKSLEKLLNSNEDKFVLNAIKNYKDNKDLDSSTLKKLKISILQDKEIF
jgi:hypothetical protein